MFLISGTTLPPPERLEGETRLKLSIHTKKLSEATKIISGPKERKTFSMKLFESNYKARSWVIYS